MAYNVKEIGERVSDRCGLPIQTTLVGSVDQNAVKILNAIKDCAKKDIWKVHDWRSLRRTHTFKWLASTNSYDLPVDCEPERISKDTVRDRVADRLMIGPINDTEWEQYQSGVIGASEFSKVWAILPAIDSFTNIHKMQFFIYPTPDTDASISDSIAFTYISNLFVVDSAKQNAKSGVTQDTDLFLLDDSCVEAGATVRVLRSLGLDYTEEVKEFNDLMFLATGKDADSKRCFMSAGQYVIGVANIPETGLG